MPGGFAYEPNRQTTIDVRGDIQDLDTVRNLAIIPASAGAEAAPNARPERKSTQLRGRHVCSAGRGQPVDGQQLRSSASATSRPITDGYEPRSQYAHVSGQSGALPADPEGLRRQRSRRVEQRAQELPADPAAVSRHLVRSHQRPIEVHAAADRPSCRTLLEAILLDRHRDDVLPALVAQRDRRLHLDPDVAGDRDHGHEAHALTIDTVSLLGMSLVIGILVDDSTVVLENIERHFTELKQPPEEAAVDGREEIGAAAVVITLVDVVVFFPIAFIQGQVGRQIAEFAIVVVISTLTSLFVSFTVTPTLAGLWALRSHWKPAELRRRVRATRSTALRDWYTDRVLPWASITGGSSRSFAPPVSSARSAWSAFGLVGEEFIPPVDRGEIYIQLAYPIGTPVTDGQKMACSTSSRRFWATAGHLCQHGCSGRVLRPRSADSFRKATSAKCTCGSKTGASNRPIYWVAQFTRRSRRMICPKRAGVSSCRRPGRRRKRATDRLPRHRPDRRRSDRLRRRRCMDLLADGSGRDQRQQHGHAARAGDLGAVRSQQGASARRGSSAKPRKPPARPSAATSRRSSRRPQGLEQVQVIYPRSIRRASRQLKSVADPLVERFDRPPRRLRRASTRRRRRR